MLCSQFKHNLFKKAKFFINIWAENPPFLGESESWVGLFVGWESQLEGSTSCPRAICGQQYPLPCLAYFDVKWKVAGQRPLRVGHRGTYEARVLTYEARVLVYCLTTQVRAWDRWFEAKSKGSEAAWEDKFEACEGWLEPREPIRGPRRPIWDLKDHLEAWKS